jgi:hypothetical protein
VQSIFGNLATPVVTLDDKLYSSSVYLNDYYLFRKDRKKCKGGGSVHIYVKNTIACELIYPQEAQIMVLKYLYVKS